MEKESGGGEDEGRYRVRDGGCGEGFGSAFVVGGVLDIVRWRFGNFKVLGEEERGRYVESCIVDVKGILGDSSDSKSL